MNNHTLPAKAYTPNAVAYRAVATISSEDSFRGWLQRHPSVRTRRGCCYLPDVVRAAQEDSK